MGLEMSRKVVPTSYQGVRYREDPKKKKLSGGRYDRYYFIRYWTGEKHKEEGVGWASEKMTAEKANSIRAQIVENIRTGKGPQSLKAMREQERQEQAQKQIEQKEAERKIIPYGKFFTEEYFPTTSLKKKQGSIEAELALNKKWITPVLDDIPLMDIGYSEIEKIINSMRSDGKKPSSIKYVLSIISQVWAYARNKDVVTGEAPTKKFKISRLDNERTRFLSKEEARTLLDELGKHSLELRDMAMLSLFCGLRAGEIFKLQWVDVDMQNGTILLRGTKAGNSRYAFFTPEVHAIFSERIKARPQNDDYVFPATNGKKRDRISKTFSRVVDALGFNEGVNDPKQKVVFHSLRHTFASWLVQGQIPLYNVQRLMGHSEIRMTQRYSHLSDESMRNAVNVLNGALEPASDENQQAKVIEFKKNAG